MDTLTETVKAVGEWIGIAITPGVGRGQPRLNAENVKAAIEQLQNAVDELRKK